MNQKATFAAGCFWGVEALFKQKEGVIQACSGYTGGHVKNPTYEQVCRGDTGHAEAVEVTYDPNKVNFRELVKYFFRLHDPTTRDRQGFDVGSQYRSAIFYHSDEQKREAESYKNEFDVSGVFKNKAVTEIVAASTFYPAEDFHQDYYAKKGIETPTCHILRER